VKIPLAISECRTDCASSITWQVGYLIRQSDGDLVPENRVGDHLLLWCPGNQNDVIRRRLAGNVAGTMNVRRICYKQWAGATKAP
jgi:hypothetical protein